MPTTTAHSLIPTAPAWVDLDALCAPDVRADIVEAVERLAPLARQVAAILAPHAGAIARAAALRDLVGEVLVNVDEDAYPLANRVVGADLLHDLCNALGAGEDGPLAPQGWADLTARIGGEV